MRSSCFVFLPLLFLSCDAAALVNRRKRNDILGSFISGLTRTLQGEPTQLSDFGVNLSPESRQKAGQTFGDAAENVGLAVKVIQNDGFDGLLKLLNNPAIKEQLGGAFGGGAPAPAPAPTPAPTLTTTRPARPTTYGQSTRPSRPTEPTPPPGGDSNEYYHD